MTPPKTFTLPPQDPDGQPVTLEQGSRVVVVGANGSGKTRFGIRIEEQNQSHTTVHRISAQKVLNLPDYAPVKNLEEAERELLFGRSDRHASIDRKIHDRWGGSPATFLLTDYEKLLGLLFAKTAERDRLHTEKTRATGTYVPVPDSPIDSIVTIWSDLMPHRTVSFNDGKVMVGKGSATEYHAKEMSDGERVVLYLLGQCLCAPLGALLIVDEPELHLHKSLMDKLWNKVEQLCPDKTLIYITHDLDFAASRAGAAKVWTQSFSGTHWVWRYIPVDEALPEALILEIIGNRKQLLLCEGERGGLDHTIYQLCYPAFHVIPRGGSDKVIETTKALKGNGDLHKVTARGIIDRDVRSEAEVLALAAHGVEILAFAEIENLLCTEKLVTLVATRLSLSEADVLAAVTKYVSDALKSELDSQIAMRAQRRIRYQLSQYSAISLTESGLQQGVTTLIGTLSVPSLWSEAQQTINDAITNNHLNDLLRVYNRKSLSERISVCFGLKKGEYPALVLRLLKGPDAELFAAALRSVLPVLAAA